MQYSVCASALFTGIPLPRALHLIRQSGYTAYEFWSWWDQDMDAVLAAQTENGLTCAALCAKFASLTDPACRAEYLKGLEESVAAAHRLGAKRLISQVGMDTLAPRGEQHGSIALGLRAAAPLLAREGITLVIEPLNTLVDHKGYYLSSSKEGFDIIRQVGSPNVKLLFDIYHQQITEGNLIANMTAGADLIGHVHIAGTPGRHEVLTRCEVNYPAVLQALGEAGYGGYVGLEYFPLGDAAQGLEALQAAMPL